MTNDPMTAFLLLMNRFLRNCCEAEYRSHALKIITKIINDIYDKDKPPALAMEEILWYLASAFPKHVSNLKPMEQLCQKQIAKLEEATS